MVTSRRRKKKENSPPKVYKVTPPSCQKKGKPCQKDDTAEILRYKRMDKDDYVCEPIDYEAALAAWESSHGLHSRHQTTELHVQSFKMAASAKEAARIFQIWGRAKIEAVVENGSHEEAAEILRSNRDPLRRLKRLLWVLQMQDVPTYDLLGSDTGEVVQAVQYCKSIGFETYPIPSDLFLARMNVLRF